MKRCFLVTMVCVLASAPDRAWALGEEEFGNRPQSDRNYTEWPGIIAVVNAEARVYRSWVNGNEQLYFQGGTSVLNDALRDYATVKSDVRRVIIRPGPGEAHTFHGKNIACDWDLHLVGGIAGRMTTLDKGDLIWSKFPVLTVYIGESIDPQKLIIPAGVTLLSLADVKRQYVTAVLKSSDKTVRGWGCGGLANLDPYDDESVQVITERLRNDDDWVRLNAAGALEVFGAKAKSALSDLRKATQSEDARLKEAAEKAIHAVTAAADTSEAERQHKAAIAEIDKFLDGHR
ncbi:MAG TPA: HEAT repeat domain-containing protein, partial [Planctomycetaceae bacterium]